MIVQMIKFVLSISKLISTNDKLNEASDYNTSSALPYRLRTNGLGAQAKIESVILYKNNAHIIPVLIVKYDAVVRQITELSVKNTDSIISTDETLELSVDTVIAPLENNILSSYIEPITSLYKWYKDFLSTLTLEQIGAVIHLSSIASIVLCLFTIIATLPSGHGDFLIKYFKLEEKYPKLARIIQFRRKMKMYSVVFNFFLIFLVLLFLTYFNLYILFKV